jgi:5'-AMP-activated protein kinase catalytic alpha subunit
MKLTLSRRPTSYGKYVDIDSFRPDNSIQKLTGKVISKISPLNQSNMEQITNEIEANQKLRHPHVLRLQMYLHDEVFHYLVFPATETKDLRAIMVENKRLCEEAARPIFRELILGVQHIHSNHVIHGQITPSAVLFHKDHVKLSDFSLCTVSEGRPITPSKSGPAFYMSPETLRDGPFDGPANDVWSCGVILYEMLAGRLPFGAKSKSAVVAEIKNGHTVYPKYFSSAVIFLLKAILNPTPHDRASVEQILAHPWMLKTREIPISHLLRPSAIPTARRSVKSE